VNGSALARFGIGLIVVCCAAPGVALADTPTLNPSGTLTFSWQGDPARGCQAAGVCAVSGSLEVIPADQSGSMETPATRTIQIEDDNSVVRVIDPGSTPSQPHVCTQPVPISTTLIIARPRHSKRLQAFSASFLPPSSGDCAGPSASSLNDLTLPVRRLPGPREAYDLSGTQTFAAGPYQVTVTSTIRARRPRRTESGSLDSSGSGSGFPFPKPHEGLIEGVSMQYQVTSTRGTITTKFAGRSDPFCLPLDACGASGMVTDSISGISRKLEFVADRVVFQRASRRQALADFRSGRLALQDTEVLLGDVLSAAVGWPDGSACMARLSQHNALDLDVSGSRGRRPVRLKLSADQLEDPLRNACPGPAASEMLGSSDALARGSLAVSDLGKRDLNIAVSGHGNFVIGSYAGSRSASVTVELRLLRVRAGTVATQVFPGQQ
jgi:hypothetical protein